MVYFIISYTVMLGQKVFCPLVSLNILYYETGLFICQEENVYFYVFSLYYSYNMHFYALKKHSLSIFPVITAVTGGSCNCGLLFAVHEKSPTSGITLSVGEFSFSYRFISILLLHFFSCRHFLFLHNTFECGGQTCQSLQIGRNNNLCCLSICQNTECLEAL